MGKAVDCGRDRSDGCTLDALEKVDKRLLMYELARSSFALEGGEVTRGGNEVRLMPSCALEAGSLRGDKTSAAMSGCVGAVVVMRDACVYMVGSEKSAMA